MLLLLMSYNVSISPKTLQMKKIILSALALSFSLHGFSQEENDSIPKEKKTTVNKFLDNLSGSFESNIQWYNDDKKLGDFTELKKDVNGEDHLRANSYLRLDYSFLKNFTVGIQAESYSPMSLLNYSDSFDQEIGIALFYANFKNNKLDITLGNFYEQYGSGLILRAWEDRALGRNNSIRGARIAYSLSKSINVSAFWGQPRTGFVNTSIEGGKLLINYNISDPSLFGANTEIDLATMFKLEKLNSLNVGFSYVGKKEDYVTANIDPNVPELSNSFSSRIDADFGKVYTSFEYVWKGSESRLDDAEQVVEKLHFDGKAALWTLGYSQKGFGVSNTFRRLEGMNFYSERTAAGSSNIYGDKIVNYLPGLTKQHDYTLTNIYVYQAQPGLNFVVNKVNAGEIGNQFDLYYKFKKGSAFGGKYGTKVAANISYWAGLTVKVTDPTPSGGIGFSKDASYKAEALNFKKKYFRDFNIEVRKKFSPKFSGIATYVNTIIDKDLATGSPLGVSNKFIQSNIGVLEGTYKLGKGKSARLELQHLSVKKAKPTNRYYEDNNDWVGGTLEFNLNSKIGIYANDSWNYDNDVKDDRIHYYNFGGSYTKGASRVGVNYGRQRGGLLCVGGVCRVVSPNTGFTINLTTSF